jgi:hypothetical protein
MLGVLSLLRDPRTADLYMQCVLRGHTSIRWRALEELADLMPRPTHLVDRLAQMIETNRFPSPLDEEKAVVAILRIGRQDTKPLFERLARDHNESRADLALRALKTLALSAASKESPKDKEPRTREPETVRLPETKI